MKKFFKNLFRSRYFIKIDENGNFGIYHKKWKFGSSKIVTVEIEGNLDSINVELLFESKADAENCMREMQENYKSCGVIAPPHMFAVVCPLESLKKTIELKNNMYFKHQWNY